MDLKTYLLSLTPERRQELAKQCDTSVGHLHNVMYGLRPCAPDIAVVIERESNKTVRRWDLRPDDWHRIWPELIRLQDAPAISADQPSA